MSYCMILYVSREVNENLQKIAIRNRNKGLRMCRNNPVVVVCFVSLDRYILEKPEKGHSSQLHELFLIK